MKDIVTELNRRISRHESKVAEMNKEHLGNELKFSYWGGHSKGYSQGMIAAFEICLDLLEDRKNENTKKEEETNS